MAFGKKKPENLISKKDFEVKFSGFNNEGVGLGYLKAEEELDSMEDGDLGFKGLLNDAPKPKQKSVAKTYGNKYVSDGVSLASSKVVDVRSFEKDKPKPIVKRPSSVVDDDFGAPPKRKSSFFDDLLKELDEEMKNEKKEEDVEVTIKEPTPVKKETKPVVKKVDLNKPIKKKKNIDIDIISGDFGDLF